jgi:Mn-dependent DtxR family transcriptional regulator
MQTPACFLGVDARPDNAEPELRWLARMGVVDVDEHGAWRLTALGTAAMARFKRMSAPQACLTIS